MECIFGGNVDGVFHLVVDAITIPGLLGVLFDMRFYAVGRCGKVLNRNQNAGVSNLADIIFDVGPPCAVMRYNHRIAKEETQNEVLIVFRHFEVFERANALPEVGVDDECALGFAGEVEGIVLMEIDFLIQDDTQIVPIKVKFDESVQTNAFKTYIRQHPNCG